MTLHETLVDVWRQALVNGQPRVEVGGAQYRVGRTRGAELLIVSFTYEGRTLEGIEQNPNTSSRWAKLAQEGKQIMQFSASNRFFANVCDGVLTRYPSWTALNLPD
jgi:hypothetical protein